MKRIALLMCAVMALALPAAAQDDELPISEGYVFKWENEIIFPMGVRFRLTLSSPVESLREVTLTIEASGSEPVTVEIDLEEPAATGPGFTEVDYVWAAPDNAPLRVFSDEGVIYEWNAVDNAGATARVRDALVFQDERINWAEDEDPLGHLDLIVVADGPSPRQIRQSVMLAYNLISANTGRTPAFDILLYPADLDPSGCVMIENEETGEEERVAVGPVSSVRLPCDPQRAAEIIAASGLELVRSDGTTAAGAQTALVNFLARQFYEPFWGEADVPDWFLSGLATFYQPASKTTLMLSVRDAARIDSLLTLADMAVERKADLLWRAQSFAMVLYIADQIGVDGLFDLARALADSASFQAAYEAATGQALNALLPNLRRWVFTGAADSAFNYHPYLADTPTPLPSMTNTPFPPTATDTPPPTETATITPSVTGVLSATPSRTPTLTRTPTPAPATVTPRPVGSLFTPTPVPVSVLESPVNRVGIIAVLLILLAIIVLIYWVLNRRRL
jgi:hypothetical protein